MTDDNTSAPPLDLDAMEARLTVPTCSRCGAVGPQTEPAEYWDGRAYDRHVGCPQEHGLFASDVSTHPLTREDQRALVARVRRLEALRDDIAAAFDGLVMKVWRAAGETHEPPADVAALTDRIDALRCESESLARRLAGRDETNANLLGRLIAAENAVAAARREGAEAMREACAAECDAEASSLSAAIERGSVTAEPRRREATLLADALRALPLPGGEP